MTEQVHEKGRQPEATAPADDAAAPSPAPPAGDDPWTDGAESPGGPGAPSSAPHSWQSSRQPSPGQASPSPPQPSAQRPSPHASPQHTPPQQPSPQPFHPPAVPPGGTAGKEAAGPDPDRRRGALDIIVDVIVAPANAFRYLARHRHLDIAFLMAFAGFLADSASTGTPPGLEEFGVTASSGPVTTILSSLIAAAVVVPVMAGIFHVFARLFGGKGQFASMLQAVGFSSVVSLLAAPFQALERVFESELLGSVVVLAVAVWQLTLIVIAVREMYRVSTARAVVAVLVPTFIGIGLLVFLTAILLVGLTML